MTYKEAYNILELMSVSMSAQMEDMRPQNPMRNVLSQRVAAIKVAQNALYDQKEEKKNSQGGWISVKDRLPADGYDVLAVVSGKPSENIELINAYVLASYEEDCGWFIEEYPDWENFRVTYWMPLPEPPREEPS